MSVAVDVLSWLLLVAGSLLTVIAGVGLVRLPDFFARLHAAGIIDTLAAALILAGLGVQAGLTQVSIKLLLILVFLFLTTPTATHAIAHAALVAGLKPWTRRRRDE